MSIIRIHKNDNFSIINNECINNKNLSWGATGLMVYLLSKPDNWKILLEQLKKQKIDGVDSTRSKLKELEKEGYLVKGERIREKGKLKGYEYDLYENLCWKNKVRKTKLENPTIVNTELINTELIKNNGGKPPKDESIDSSIISEKRKKISESLKNNIIKKNKKQLNVKNISPIVKESIKRFEKIVISVFPKIKKEGLTSDEEIYKTQERINFFIKGTNKNKFSSINKDWLEENNIPNPKTILNENNFLDYLEKAMMIYSVEYKPDNKSKLPTRLSDFLYNSNRKLLKSYFLFYAFNPPKKIEELKLLKNNNPDMTDFYEKYFFKRDLSLKEKNLLIKECERIKEYYDDCFNREIKLKNGKKKKVRELLYYLDNLGAPLSDLKHFIMIHVEWLNNALRGKGKIPHINFMKCNNGFWDSFMHWLEEVYDINLSLLFDDEKVIELSRFRKSY